MNTRINLEAEVIDLGLTEYQKAWDFQTSLFNQNLAIKSDNRSRPDSDQIITRNHIIFCEHPHVFTMGKSGDEKNLLISREKLGDIHADFFPTNRGGDMTYHGPGQIVVYPVLDLENFFTDIHRYMRTLEEAVIQTLSEFSITAGRIEKLTGVWIDPESDHPKKICALGVKMSRWITLHGLALNVNPDLKFFDLIVPCGINDKGVTSMEMELGKKQDIEAVRKILRSKIISLFQLRENLIPSV